MMSARRRRRQRWQIAGTIAGLIAFAIFGGWLNWMAYSAHVCQTVPNHYSCDRSESN